MKTKDFLTLHVDPGALRITARKHPDTQQQTLTSDVWVPLTQNILGGIAVGILAFIFCLGHRTTHHTYWQTSDILRWCFLGGIAITCLMTIIRFFSDAVGIVAAAYTAGQRSMLHRLSTLEGSQIAVQQAMQQKRSYTSAEIRAIEMFTRARDDAERLILLYFAGKKVDRKSMTDRGMGQRDWERARRLMHAAGVISDDGAFSMQTVAEATAALNERFAKDAKRKGAAQTFVPAWQ